VTPFRPNDRLFPVLLSGLSLLLLTCLGPAPVSRVYQSDYDARTARNSERLSAQTVRIEILEEIDRISVESHQPIALTSSGLTRRLPPGKYRLHAQNAVPAKQRFHLFAKVFELDESEEQYKYIESLQRQGFEPRIIPVGKRYSTASGTDLDTRTNWISIARFPSEDDAADAKRDLEQRNIWTWSQAETFEPGHADIDLVTATGTIYGPFKTPLHMNNNGVLSIGGDHNSSQSARAFAGTLEFNTGPGGRLALTEIVPLDTYLQGVVPAEMPPLWPIEALKAQAVAARSQVLASLGTKHKLEGFDFCNAVHCRAYFGSYRTHDRSSYAVRVTQTQILTRKNRIAPTVFSSNCGGWTENNDTVWAGPPQDALRGVSDLAPRPRNAAGTPSAGALADWLIHPPDAYCRDDKTYFRWKQTYSNAALSDIVNRQFEIGKIEDIELGERGVSGRLKWIRIHGTKGDATVRKELPIRQAFGGLPSALFIIDEKRDGTGAVSFTFIGGGRGHGVGLCQHGARGMALQGATHDAILSHYYSGVTIERYQ